MAVKSWLKKFGSVLKTIFVDIGKVESKVKPIVEELLPASAPFFDVFDAGVEVAKNLEVAFNAAGQASNGPAKLKAALPGLSAALDAYTLAKFPGSSDVLKTEAYIASKPVLMNAIVQYLNSLPDTLEVKPTSSSIAIAAAVSAAVSTPATA